MRQELINCYEICSMPVSNTDKLELMKEELRRLLPIRKRKAGKVLWNVTVVLSHPKWIWTERATGKELFNTPTDVERRAGWDLRFIQTILEKAMLEETKGTIPFTIEEL